MPMDEGNVGRSGSADAAKGKGERPEPTTTEEAHREIELTRERMAQTIGEIDARISAKVAEVKHTANPMTHASAHPWPALLAAVAAGVAIGATGAEKKAAVAAGSAAVEGAKRAPGAAVAATKATGRGAARLASAAKEKMSSSEDESTTDSGRQGVFARLKASAERAIVAEAQVLSAELERATREVISAFDARNRGGGGRVS